MRVTPRAWLAALILAAVASTALLLAHEDRAASAQPAAAVEAPIAPAEAPSSGAKIIGSPAESPRSLPSPAPPADDPSPVAAASTLPNAREAAADPAPSDPLPDIVRGGPTRPLKPHLR